MQQNKHEYLPRERCYFMGHEVFTKKKESKIRTFLLSRERGREGRFNSLNFNWIEIIVSLSLGHWKYFNSQKLKIFLLNLENVVPSIFYCYRNKSIWSWSKFLQQFYFLSSPRLHMKSYYPRTSWWRSLGCLPWNTFSLFVYFLFCVMDPVMPLKYFKRICPSYYNA